MPLAKPRYTHQLPTAKPKFCGDISGTEPESRPAWKPRRASPEAFICGVTLLAKGYCRCRRSVPCNWTLQDSLRHYCII